MAFAGQPGRPLVVHLRGREPDQRHHAAQEDVHFLKIRKFREHPGGDQPVIRVVEHHLGPHGRHQLVESLGGHPLEPGVGIPLGTDAVNHLIPGQVLVHHLVHRVDIILPVAVDGYCDITAVLRFHQAGQHRVLVSPVPALADSDAALVILCQFPDNLPGPVRRSVVHKQHPAVPADPAAVCQLGQLLSKHRGRHRQHLFFVIAGNNHPQNRSCFHVSGPSFRAAGNPPAAYVPCFFPVI